MALERRQSEANTPGLSAAVPENFFGAQNFCCPQSEQRTCAFSNGVNLLLRRRSGRIER
jgi:hypothetical protein